MKSVLKDDLLGLKSKLENLEKEIGSATKETEDKESKFKKIEERLNEYLNSKDSVITLNIGGKKFLTKTSTLLNIKDSLFYTVINSYIDKGAEIPKEIFFDRRYQNFRVILDFMRTKSINIKSFSKYEKEDIVSELEFYGLADDAKLIKKGTIDIGWDQALSKAGACTVNRDDNKNLRIHSVTCYTHFVTNRTFDNENFVIEFESTVSQSDNYFYIGIVNNMYSLTGNCMCCNPPNSYYIQCDGSIHINSTKISQPSLAWYSQKVVIGMRVKLKEMQIYFYIPDKFEAGPYNISHGYNFRVVAGHCNAGNGEITILDCYESD